MHSKERDILVFMTGADNVVPLVVTNGVICPCLLLAPKQTRWGSSWHFTSPLDLKDTSHFKFLVINGLGMDFLVSFEILTLRGKFKYTT